MPVFRGPYFQSITFRLKNPAAFDDARRALQDDKRMTVDAHRESDFYSQQSQLLGRILAILAWAITSIMAGRAAFRGADTMFPTPRARTAAMSGLQTLAD